ncbi:MAG: hypothetical protein WC026_13260 [Hyphomicrobium sp.]|uniref:hypothetical protein n=1 Tax=Hyphomicrobium sp. TaxID=82 RepID=UPI0035656529
MKKLTVKTAKANTKYQYVYEETSANYSFKPNEELLEFAKEFSDSYTKLRVGDYVSNAETYKIKYLSQIKDKGVHNKTGARVSNSTGIIELDKKILKHKCITPDFVFLLILWCIARYESKYLFSSELVADETSLKYYLTTVRSKRNAIVGWVKLLSHAQTEQNKERLKKMFEILDSERNDTKKE